MSNILNENKRIHQTFLISLFDISSHTQSNFYAQFDILDCHMHCEAPIISLAKLLDP